MTLKITPLSGTIGAEISGIDLRNLSNSEFDAVHRAFLDHAVLCFRNQDLTPDDQIAFARRWGEMRSSLSQRLADRPEIIEIVKGPANEIGSAPIGIRIKSSPTPAMATMLRLEVPPVGGDTLRQPYKCL